MASESSPSSSVARVDGLFSLAASELHGPSKTAKVSAKAMHPPTPTTAPCTPSPCCTSCTSHVEPDAFDLGGTPLKSAGDGCHSLGTKGCCAKPSSPPLHTTTSIIDLLHSNSDATPSSSPTPSLTYGATKGKDQPSPRPTLMSEAVQGGKPPVTVPFPTDAAVKSVKSGQRENLRSTLEAARQQESDAKYAPCSPWFYNPRCKGAGVCKCTLSELQYAALRHDVVKTIKSCAQLSTEGQRVRATQEGVGDGLFNSELEPALRVVGLAAMGHGHKSFGHKYSQLGEKLSRKDKLQTRTDKTFWEPHAARDKCVDCKTKLVRRSHCRSCGRCVCRLCGERNKSTETAMEMYGDDAKFCSDCADSHCLLDASYRKLHADYGRDWLASLSPLDALRAVYKTLGGKHDRKFILPNKKLRTKQMGPRGGGNSTGPAKSCMKDIETRPDQKGSDGHMERVHLSQEDEDARTRGAAAVVADEYKDKETCSLLPKPIKSPSLFGRLKGFIKTGAWTKGC